MAHAAVTLEEGALLPSRSVLLPGGPGLVRMDYIEFDPATHAVWIPAGNTGRVDVLDTTTGAIRTVDGFVTAETESRRGRRTVGPSSVAVGAGVVFVGNRGNSQICPIDSQTLQTGSCATLGSMPDGLALVPTTHELWVTTPRDSSITVLHVDGSASPQAVTTLALGGHTEGYAVDPTRGRFYTNLEDHDRTLSLDLTTRQIVATWQPACGGEGPHGLALDVTRGFLFVACDDRVETLDVAHDGAIVGTAATGGGVDSIDYAPGRNLIYVASGDAAKMRFVRVDAHGGLRVVASAPTVHGARNAVADDQGRAYVEDSNGGRLFVVDPPRE